MSGRCNEELLAKVVADKLVIAHGHVRETCTVKLMVDTVDIIGTLEVVNNLSQPSG